MTVEEIRSDLFSLREEKYRDFQSRLIPGISPDRMIGIRTPALRHYAKELSSLQDVTPFLQDLPHRYFDENQLHAFLISGIPDFDHCVSEIERFLPFVDNWATCDQMSPKVFRGHRQELLSRIRVWLASGRTYTVRFGVKMLMDHFLDEDFAPSCMEAVAQLRSEEYYVRTAIAWYFATSLAKQYDAALPYLTEHRLDPWTHTKTIQKAIESYRIPEKRKQTLKKLRAGRAE